MCLRTNLKTKTCNSMIPIRFLGAANEQRIGPAEARERAAQTCGAGEGGPHSDPRERMRTSIACAIWFVLCALRNTFTSSSCACSSSNSRVRLRRSRRATRSSRTGSLRWRISSRNTTRSISRPNWTGWAFAYAQYEYLYTSTPIRKINYISWRLWRHVAIHASLLMSKLCLSRN